MGSRHPSRRVLLSAVVCAFSVAAPGPAIASTDQYRSQEWGLDAIAAPAAWTQSDGKNVVVAVLDSGVQIDHPDLVGNIWTNPNETVNGIDDDGNGIVDDVHGANTLSHTGDVDDTDGHGTHIAGIIAARAGNGVGIAGVAPGATIMPVKVWSARGGDTGTVAEGIRYAVSEGATILNISMNADADDPALRDAVQFADDHGVTIVASAGNDGRDIDSAKSYPASYPNPSVLTVTATTPHNHFFRGSNWGTGDVDLSAPGDMIVSLINGSTYELNGGTSMAAPFVAGSLALLESARPDLSQAQLREALLASAKRTSEVAGRVGAGELDVAAAMHRLVPGQWGANRAAKVRVRTARIARMDRKVAVRWSAAGTPSVATWLVKLDGRNIVTVRAHGRHRAACWARGTGRHAWTVVGLDASGRHVVKAHKAFRVTA
jgi:subtilisin family serine protease